MTRDLKDRGMSNRENAKDLGISKNTVSKLLSRTRLRITGKERGVQSLNHIGSTSVVNST